MSISRTADAADDQPVLQRIDLSPTWGALPRRLGEWIVAASQAGRHIDCFDYVPSNPMTLFAHLESMPRGRFCEWGSGMGIGVAIAETLGFDACGLELSPSLVAASQRLLCEHAFAAQIHAIDYLDQSPPADVYFVYCWPGQAQQVQQRFLEVAPENACLLFGEGAERLAAYRKSLLRRSCSA